jgi:Effector-associated domain 1
MSYEHELHKALIEAFTVEGLERMLRYQMGLDLETISTASDKESVVTAVVSTAAREGWLRGLVNAAFESNPGNEKLQSLKRISHTQKAPYMQPYEVYRPVDGDGKRGLDDRVTELEFLIGSRGVNGIMKSVQRLDERMQRIESSLALRNDTPIGPRAMQFLLLLIAVATAIAAAQPTWGLIMLIWSRFGGG